MLLRIQRSEGGSAGAASRSPRCVAITSSGCAIEYGKRRRIQVGRMSSNGLAKDGGRRRAGGRPPREFDPVTQRERLIDAMALTVAQRGYAATSVADVLKAARISRRTFYEQFADKEDCFLAAYDQIVARCVERVTDAFHAASSWEDGIALAVDALLHVLAAEPAFARLGVVEVLGAGPRGLACRDTTLGRFAHFIEISRADLTEPPSPPPELVAHAIVGGIYELVYSHILRNETDRLPELAAGLRHYTFMLLGTPPRPT
jgi:AcrR family transcriptional regulator